MEAASGIDGGCSSGKGHAVSRKWLAAAAVANVKRRRLLQPVVKHTFEELQLLLLFFLNHA